MGQRSRRIVFFVLCVLAGLAIGLTYGWVINPVQHAGSARHALRIDFKTDLILMVAELYQDEGDINLALERLRPLGETPLLELLTQAISFAEEHQYAPADIQTLQDLASAVETALSIQ
jgi:hypothetical protein